MVKGEGEKGRSKRNREGSFPVSKELNQSVTNYAFFV